MDFRPWPIQFSRLHSQALGNSRGAIRVPYCARSGLVGLENTLHPIVLQVPIRVERLALVAVAQQLADGLLQRAIDGGILEFTQPQTAARSRTAPRPRRCGPDRWPVPP